MRALLFVIGLAMCSPPAAVFAQDSGSRPTEKARGKSAPAKAGARNKRGKPKAKPSPNSDGKPRARGKSLPARRARRSPPAESAPAPEPAPQPAPSAPHVPRLEDAAALSADAEERIREEGGSEIKTVEFGGLDIEGQLKTPQMLYFLNRLRAEFARPELPHRSFIPELQRGTKESAF